VGLTDNMISELARDSDINFSTLSMPEFLRFDLTNLHFFKSKSSFNV